MAGSLQHSFCNLTKPYSTSKPSKSCLIRSQAFHDPQGNSANMVDANMSVLKERIIVEKKRGKLETCCRIQHGWDYRHVRGEIYRDVFADFSEIATSVYSAVGFVFLSGTFSIFLVSFLVHLCNL